MEANVITGAHAIIYSSNVDADRAFFRDVLKFPNVDVGEGWLIFELPPAELAIHPADTKNIHEIYLMCDEIQEVLKQLAGQKIACSKIEELSWGSLTRISLPGGGSLGIYQARHARPAAGTW
jgi:hypothetical protein